MKEHTYSLADFLKENFIPDIRLLTKPQDFKNILIEQVSVQELPAQTFIHNNELVLTTAVGCQDERSFSLLIEEMSHASAIFLTFQDDTTQLPPSVISLAEKYNLPLFTIPWECRFSEIQAYIIRRVQEKRVEIYQNLQTGLMNAFFEDRSLQDATNLIETVLHCSVSVIDKNGHPQNTSKNKDNPLLDIVIAREVPILMNRRIFGVLVFHSSNSQDLIYIDQTLLERYICFPLSMWFNRKSNEDLLVMRLKNDFVLNLATGNYTSYDDMIVHGRRLRFNLNKPYTCVILRGILNVEDTEKNRYSSETAADTTAIEALLISEGKHHRQNIMVGARSLEFIAYIENHIEDTEVKIESFLDSTDKKLKELFPSYSFYWGISEISLKASDFCRLFKNAELALQHCLNSSRKRYRCSYQDTKEARIISVLARDLDVQQIVRDTVGVLQDYDANSDIDLLGTLLEFVKCNYNTSKTARNLHIHRQSLLYRFEKIEELTGYSLNNHQDLFLLEVCTRILVGDNHS